jgi:hypothetical protein
VTRGRRGGSRVADRTIGRAFWFALSYSPRRPPPTAAARAARHILHSEFRVGEARPLVNQPPQTGFDPQDPRVRGFFRDLLHRTIHMALGATIWRLPTIALVLLIVGAIAVVMYFGWY